MQLPTDMAGNGTASLAQRDLEPLPARQVTSSWRFQHHMLASTAIYVLSRKRMATSYMVAARVPTIYVKLASMELLEV
jgi:hypothetical protein